MLNEVQMQSQARITPQLLLNGNYCLNKGESMHIFTAVICKGRIPHLNLAKTEHCHFWIGFNRYGSTLNSFLNVTCVLSLVFFLTSEFNILIFNSALNYFKIILKFRNKFIFKSIGIHYSPDL